MYTVDYSVPVKLQEWSTNHPVKKVMTFFSFLCEKYPTAI